MILPRPLAIAVLLLASLATPLLLSCASPKTARDPHFERARGLLLEIEGKQGKVDYTRPEYDEVVRELKLVPAASPNSKEAKEILARIRAARGEPEPAADSAPSPSPPPSSPAEPVPPPPEEPVPEPPPPAEYDLAFVEQGDRVDGGRLVINGRVRNVGNREIGRVLVIVDFTDRAGRTIRNHVSHLDQDALPAGGEGTFLIRVPADRAIARYTVRFREMSGGDLRLRSEPPPNVPGP